MRKLIRSVLVGLAATQGVVALAGDFIDTRLSFVFADDNVLAGAGETTPSSPNARFGAGNQNTQFYDNFNTRYSGFETLSNLVLYKKMPAFFEGLETEAAFAALVLEKPTGAIELRDNSSYIRLSYTPPGWAKGEGVSLTGFPVSADRFRLGYAYRISWGGSNIFTYKAAGKYGVPGGKLQVQKDNWYAFFGAKTSLILNDIIQEEETNYGLMGGGGIDLLPTLRLDASGGYFQKGFIPSLATQGIAAPVNAAGVSAQAVWHVGVPVGQSVDLTLYRNDPDVAQRFFRPEVYPGGLSYSVSVEGSVLNQTLSDPDKFATTSPQLATAVAVQARAKWNLWRAHLLALYRSFSFIQFEVPGFPPYSDFPSNSELKPEMFVAVGADYHFPRFHLTPGFILGVQQPASFKPPYSVLGGNIPPQYLAGSRTLVVRDVNLVSILPSGTDAWPIFSAKATFRWDLSEAVAAIGEVYYTRDTNRTTFKDDLAGVAEPVFEKPNALGFNAILQARF